MPKTSRQLRRHMSHNTDVIALVFDFDDTLVPDSTTKLLASKGIDTNKFWQTDAKALIQRGYDPPLAYLRLMLDNMGEGKPLGVMTNAELLKFGATLDGDFHSGLPEFFEELRGETVKTFKRISIEYYIISGGLQAVVEGSSIVKKYFNGVYGCQLEGDTEDGMLKYIKRCITFTEKTRYLFEINKGIEPDEAISNPYLVNKAATEDERRVPFVNIIYVGDGLTDIPCFSLVEKLGGMAVGVFDPKKKDKAKIALQEFLKPKRVTTMHAPKFGPDDELGSMLRATVMARCLEIEVQRKKGRTQ